MDAEAIKREVESNIVKYDGMYGFDKNGRIVRGKSLVTNFWLIYDENGREVLHLNEYKKGSEHITKYEYNDDGSEVKEIKFNNGEYDGYRFKKSNDRGVMTYYISKDKDGNITSEYKYEYDDNGNLLYKKEKDKHGIKEEINRYNEYGYTEYTERRIDGKLDYKEERKFDGKREIYSKRVSVKYDGDIGITETWTEYNQRGEKISIKEKSNNLEDFHHFKDLLTDYEKMPIRSKNIVW